MPISPSRAKFDPTNPGCTALAVTPVSFHRFGQLAREQDVRELGRAVHAEALIPAVRPLEIVEVETLARVGVPGGGDVHDASAGALELLAQQVREQEVAQVVHLELGLVAVFGLRA